MRDCRGVMGVGKVTEINDDANASHLEVKKRKRGKNKYGKIEIKSMITGLHTQVEDNG